MEKIRNRDNVWVCEREREERKRKIVRGVEIKQVIQREK